MENTRNLRAPQLQVEYADTELQEQELDNLQARLKADFLSRLCRYDVVEVIEPIYKDLPEEIRRGCSSMGEIPAFTNEEEKQAHIERIQRAIENSRNGMKAVYGVAV